MQKGDYYEYMLKNLLCLFVNPCFFCASLLMDVIIFVIFLFNIFSDEYTSMRAEMADEKNPGATVMHEDNDLVRKN